MSLPYRFRLEEAAQKSGVAPDLILHFVSLTWIRPLDPVHQVFDDEDIARIQLIRELQDQMGVNDEAVPVIMHLIDQLNRIHLELKGL
jgi:chaperone modulatory protein CbpM